MILIYMESLKQVPCQICKEMDKNKNHGTSPSPPHPPLPFSLMTPYPNNTPLFHLIYIKRCVKDVEMIALKRLTQFIEKKLFLKNLRGVATTPPSEDEGLMGR